jgi:hypothetical protein
LSTTKPDQSDNQETEKLRKKWDGDDALAKASMLHHMDALETKTTSSLYSKKGQQQKI